MFLIESIIDSIDESIFDNKRINKLHHSMGRIMIRKKKFKNTYNLIDPIKMKKVINLILFMKTNKIESQKEFERKNNPEIAVVAVSIQDYLSY